MMKKILLAIIIAFCFLKTASADTATATQTATFTQTNTNTQTNTATNTATFTQTYTQTNTNTNTQTYTNTRTATPAKTATQTATVTKTYTNTRTRTNTQTNTQTFTRTATITNSPTRTATQTATQTATAGPTIVLTPSEASAPIANIIVDEYGTQHIVSHLDFYGSVTNNATIIPASGALKIRVSYAVFNILSSQNSIWIAGTSGIVMSQRMDCYIAQPGMSNPPFYLYSPTFNVGTSNTSDRAIINFNNINGQIILGYHIEYFYMN